MKRIKYAIFLLCSFAVLISLSGCRKSSENIKNVRFPTKYQKNSKNFKFDTEIIVGKERQEFLYESSAKKIKAMIQIGLDPDLKKPVEKYSMGMKQLLAIVQAIMENQDIILLDEPMNGLDIKTVEEMRAFFEIKR